MSEFDVIIVGAGGSGLAAACSVAENGGRVLVLEKLPQPGGTTGIAVGSFTAAETGIQRDNGIKDTIEDHTVDAAKFAPTAIESRNNSELREFFLNESATTLDWLQSLGVSFVGPSPEPPNRVPRMHNVVPGAKAYVAALQLALRKFGGKLICNAPVDQLLQDESGKVVGVRARVDEILTEFRADRGVILASGDYANNSKTIARYKGDQFQNIEGINPFATGDGHELALQAGAALVNMDITYGPELRFIPSSQKPFQQWLPVSGVWSKIMAAVARHLPTYAMRLLIKRLLVTWQHPENSLFDDGAILVNSEGLRFVDEKIWPDREIGVANQPNKIAYILLDSNLVERYSQWPHFISTAPDIAYAYVHDYQRLRPDVTIIGETLSDLSNLANIDGIALERTVRRAFPGSKGPWLLLGPLKAYFTTTEGGTSINQEFQVLNERGDAIPGLYAVGQNGLGGMILWGHGLHIAWAMTSGRLAGKILMGGR